MARKFFPRRVQPQSAFNPSPVAPTQYGPTGWAPIDVIPIYQQIGRYNVPLQTMIGGNWPDVQKVAQIAQRNNRWMDCNPTSNVPYFQQTQQKSSLIGALRNGASPGPTFGPAQYSQTYGEMLKNSASRANQIINGQLGW